MCGGERLPILERAERIQAGRAEMPGEVQPGFRHIGGHFQREARGGRTARRVGAEIDAIGGKDLGGVEAAQNGGQPGSVTRLGLEQAGGNIRPGDADLGTQLHDGGAEIGPPGFQQRFLGECAGGDKAHDIARQRAFGATRPGGGGVFHLLDDGDAEAAADEAGEIHFRLRHRHAAHRHRLALMLAARRERDIQRSGRRLGVGKKQLVEIPHAEEQQRVFMIGLDGEPLRHGGGSPGCIAWSHDPALKP